MLKNEKLVRKEMMRVFCYILFLLLLLNPSLLWAESASKEETYLKSEDYISAALSGKIVKPDILWITKDIRPDIKQILQTSQFPLRYRYWRQGNRTVWILNEIGKVLPITAGITIEDDKIVNLTVLTYRESHGSEIRYPAFSNQFNEVGLTENMELTKPINGISGATLSTNAMKKVSRLALYLHRKVMEKNVPSPVKK